eukprot:COSAG02_NODE_6882_length_3310_cov_1.216443_2_plen_67_part_00
MDAERAAGSSGSEEFETVKLKAEQSRKELQESAGTLKKAFELFDKDVSRINSCAMKLLLGAPPRFA